MSLIDVDYIKSRIPSIELEGITRDDYDGEGVNQNRLLASIESAESEVFLYLNNKYVYPYAFDATEKGIIAKQLLQTLAYDIWHYKIVGYKLSGDEFKAEIARYNLALSKLNDLSQGRLVLDGIGIITKSGSSPIAQSGENSIFEGNL